MNWIQRDENFCEFHMANVKYNNARQLWYEYIYRVKVAFRLCERIILKYNEHCQYIHLEWARVALFNIIAIFIKLNEKAYPLSAPDPFHQVKPYLNYIAPYILRIRSVRLVLFFHMHYMYIYSFLSCSRIRFTMRTVDLHILLTSDNNIYTCVVCVRTWHSIDIFNVTGMYLYTQFMICVSSERKLLK